MTLTGMTLMTLLGGATAVLANAAVPAQREPVKAGLTRMAWLAGNWRGQGGPMSFDERWTEAAGGVMLAVSRTLKGDRLATFEYLRIIERSGGLVYIAQLEGRPATEFVLTSITADAATFENPAHDFPKIIRYAKLADGSLEATVSDGGQKNERFVMTRALRMRAQC